MRVVIAEDQVLLREGLARLFVDGGHEVVATVGDGDAAIEVVLSERTVEAHVRHVLVKLDLPESDQDNRRVLAVLTHLRTVHDWN